MRRVVDDGDAGSPLDSLPVDDPRADELVNPKRIAIAVVAGIGQRLGKKRRVGQLLGCSTVINAIEADKPLLLLLLTRFDNSEPLRPCQQTGTRRDSLDSSRDQRDIQFAVNPMGTTDAPDFAQ